jgi:hypothetical protein
MITLQYNETVSHLIPQSSIGLQERARDGFIPSYFNPLGYTNLVVPLIIDLLIHEVNVVLFLVLVSVVPKSARLCTLQELVSIRK